MMRKTDSALVKLLTGGDETFNQFMDEKSTKIRRGLKRNQIICVESLGYSFIIQGQQKLMGILDNKNMRLINLIGESCIRISERPRKQLPPYVTLAIIIYGLPDYRVVFNKSIGKLVILANKGAIEGVPDHIMHEVLNVSMCLEDVPSGVNVKRGSAPLDFRQAHDFIRSDILRVSNSKFNALSDNLFDLASRYKNHSGISVKNTDIYAPTLEINENNITLSYR